MSFVSSLASTTSISTQRKRVAAAVVAAAFVSTGAFAQVAPGSQVVAPNRVEQRFAPVVEPQQPGSEVTPNISVPQTAIAGKLAQQFTLKRVELSDVTVYPAGTFDKIWQGDVGKTITLAQAREIAREITARYRTDGYVLSQAVIPNQDLTTGTLKIRMVEGFVDKVYVENDRPNSDRRHLIEGYAHKINQMRPLNTKTLERYMLVGSRSSGCDGARHHPPSPNTFGAADLVIKVSNKVWEGSATLDNRGNKFIGPLQGQLTLTENSAAGLGERTTIRGINTLLRQRAALLRHPARGAD